MLSLEEFLEESEEFNLIPLFEEIVGDTYTPVTIFQNLCKDDDYSYLLESADDGRYSFIGIEPEFVIRNNDDGLLISNNKGEERFEDKDLTVFIQKYIDKLNVKELECLPPFSGGFVGYFGYELVDIWEDIYHKNTDKKLKRSQIPLSVLVKAGIIIAIDHFDHTIKIISNVFIDNNKTKEEISKLYRHHKNKVKTVIKRLNKSLLTNDNDLFDREYNLNIDKLTSNTSKQEYKTMVDKGKEFIKKGDAFQIVLSQKYQLNCDLPPFQVYRALRVTNPSPYLFYLNFPDIKLIGSSPEVLVKVNNKRALTRPLAGTRPRGKDKLQDIKYKNELLNDEKEKAEHVMLLDLGRNDLGRVCEIGSIQVTEKMGIEYFSKVMHMVSQVEGKLKPGTNSLEALKAVFPAGTVSGAPKIRAMEIIDELEKEARGAYAGAVGYIDFSGNIDTCITIRTFSFKDNELTLQVGAGIVADSIPEIEYEETLNKAQALFNALKIIREDGSYDLNYR